MDRQLVSRPRSHHQYQVVCHQGLLQKYRLVNPLICPQCNPQSFHLLRLVVNQVAFLVQSPQAVRVINQLQDQAVIHLRCPLQNQRLHQLVLQVYLLVQCPVVHLLWNRQCNRVVSPVEFPLLHRRAYQPLNRPTCRQVSLLEFLLGFPRVHQLAPHLFSPVWTLPALQHRPPLLSRLSLHQVRQQATLLVSLLIYRPRCQLDIPQANLLMYRPVCLRNCLHLSHLANHLVNRQGILAQSQALDHLSIPRVSQLVNRQLSQHFSQLDCPLAHQLVSHHVTLLVIQLVSPVSHQVRYLLFLPVANLFASPLISRLVNLPCNQPRSPLVSPPRSLLLNPPGNQQISRQASHQVILLASLLASLVDNLLVSQSLNLRNSLQVHHRDNREVGHQAIQQALQLLNLRGSLQGNRRCVQQIIPVDNLQASQRTSPLVNLAAIRLVSHPDALLPLRLENLHYPRVQDRVVYPLHNLLVYQQINQLPSRRVYRQLRLLATQQVNHQLSQVPSPVHTHQDSQQNIQHYSLPCNPHSRQLANRLVSRVHNRLSCSILLLMKRYTHVSVVALTLEQL